MVKYFRTEEYGIIKAEYEDDVAPVKITTFETSPTTVRLGTIIKGPENRTLIEGIMKGSTSIYLSERELECVAMAEKEMKAEYKEDMGDHVSCLTDEEKESIYRSVWCEHVKDDIRTHLEDMDDVLTERQIDYAAHCYVYEGKYDCTMSYWDNIEGVILLAKTFIHDNLIILDVALEAIREIFDQRMVQEPGLRDKICEKLQELPKINMTDILEQLANCDEAQGINEIIYRSDAMDIIKRACDS